MTTDAKRKANARYDSQNMVTRTVKFSPRETDMLAHLDAQPNKAGYIKSLILADMEGRVDWSR